MILYNLACDFGSDNGVAYGDQRTNMEHSKEVFNPKQRREHCLKILLYINRFTCRSLSTPSSILHTLNEAMVTRYLAQGGLSSLNLN